MEGVYAHPRLRKVAWGYCFLVVPFIPLLPIIASDFVVMLPALMVYMLGLGPVFAVIRDPPTCAECGGLLSRRSLALGAAAPALPGRAGRITQPLSPADTLPPQSGSEPSGHAASP